MTFNHSMDDLLNTAPCGFIVLADDSRIVTINQTLLALLGYVSSELVGHKVEVILTVASRIFYQTHFFPLITLQGKVEEVFVSLLAKGGEGVPVLVNAVRKEHEGGFLNHCVLMPVYQRRKYEDEILQAKRMAEDALQSNDELIRTKRELEQHMQDLDRKISELEQKNQELAQVSHILSHDLREPIRKISWFAELLRSDNADALTATGQQVIERISAACITADRLIHVLREFVSLDVADEALEAVDLGEVATEALRHVSESMGVRNVQLKSNPLPTVEGSRRQLTLLFRNLIENAVKFRQSEKPPLIHLAGSVVQHNSFRAIHGKYRYVDFAKIVFRDNSIGFEQKHSEHVFDALTHVRMSASGQGFGLAKCRKIVDNHHGSISVTSEPGRGATFTIMLPLKQ